MGRQRQRQMRRSFPAFRMTSEGTDNGSLGLDADVRGWGGGRTADEVAVDVYEELIAVGGPVFRVSVAQAGIIEAEQDEGLEEIILLDMEESFETGVECGFGEGARSESGVEVEEHGVEGLPLF
jgi:hypothetical protein